MGDVLLIPVTDISPFTDFNSQWGNLTSNEKEIWNTISSNGMLLISGQTNINTPELTAFSYQSASDTLYWAFFKDTNQGVDTARFVVYMPNGGYRYLAIQRTNYEPDIFGGYRFSIPANYYEVSANNVIPLQSVLNAGISVFNTLTEAETAISRYVGVHYPIHYTANNCSLNGPISAPSGVDCVVSVTPNAGYSFHNNSVIVVDGATGENIPFVVNGNKFSFVMPQF